MQDIYIDDIGSGFPLVLVHGYLGSSEMWNLQKEFLSKHFRVIAPALPGFGESYKAQPLNSINEFGKFVYKCLDEKKINEFNLIGHSMGGMIVQEMVRISEDRIKKLICFATGSIGDIPGRFEPIDTTRERLKKDGLKKTINRVPQKWFVEGKKAKNYYENDPEYKKLKPVVFKGNDWNSLGEHNLKALEDLFPGTNWRKPAEDTVIPKKVQGCKKKEI